LENVGLFFTVQSFGLLTAGLTMGRIADRVGRKPVVVAMMLVAGTSMIVLGFAASGALILASAYFSGLGQGGARNTLSALTADAFPPSERGSALSTVSMGFDLGVSFGAPLLGVVVAMSGFAQGFIVAGFASLIGTVVAIIRLHDQPRSLN